ARPHPGTGQVACGTRRILDDVANIDDFGTITVRLQCPEMVLSDAPASDQRKADRAVRDGRRKVTHELRLYYVVGGLQVLASRVDDEPGMALDHVVVEAIVIGRE